jgi:hypothetical protein
MFIVIEERLRGRERWVRKRKLEITKGGERQREKEKRREVR